MLVDRRERGGDLTRLRLSSSESFFLFYFSLLSFSSFSLSMFFIDS